MATTATDRLPERAAGLSTAEAERRLAEVGPNPEWLFLLLWPPLVLGAAELRKAVVRRRRA